MPATQRRGANNPWYRWEDADPDLEFLCSIIEKSPLSLVDIEHRIYDFTAGTFTVSNHTMRNWLKGRVRRPRNSSLVWVSFALGWERKWQPLI
jgi:hypothetical protein